MRFIWNDNRMELLENSVDFDRSQYTIARKLFIQFKADAKEINEQWIKETFQTYGEIELVEVFSNDVPWAYVTYIKDEEAHVALTKASTLNNIEQILPADTWCQPLSPSSLSSQPTATNTNEALSESLNKFEIAINEGGKDTSHLLRQLISLSTNCDTELLKTALSNRILPSVKTFNFELSDTNNVTDLSLREARSILRCIGPYICDVGVHFKMDKYPKIISRFFFKMCQYIGPNVRTIRLKNFPRNQDWLQQLQPLLGRIECLCLETSNYDFDYDIDFQLHSPNIKTLKISMNLKGELLSKNKLPKLERVSILHNQYMEEKLVLEFMKNNPQLIYLKIEANDCNNLLKQIPIHLPLLEKLCLYQAYPNISSENLVHLIEIKTLKKLKLMYLDPDDFDGILNCLPKFKQLQELKLHIFYDGVDSVDLDDVYNPNIESILTLSQELTQLECFHIRYCHFDIDTMKNFIRNAKKLKHLGIYRCGLEITDQALEDIQNIRHAINPTMIILYADKISSELNKEKTYSHVRLVNL